jgi:hypothetical protein
MSKDYERLYKTSEALGQVASTHLDARRLTHARYFCLRSNLYRTLTEPYEVLTGAWHTEGDVTVVHAVVASGERVRASLETAFASVLRCTSHAGSPARKGRSLKRIPVLIVMALVMLVGGYRTWG